MRSVVIVAGGSSTRYGKNKLNEQLFGKSILQHSVDAFLGIADQIVVVGEADVVGNVEFAPAGATRSLSVQNGLAKVNPNATVVAVHDGARPFVSRQLVEQLFQTAEVHNSAVPTLAVTDTIWQITGDVCPKNRQELFTVQTPQVFNYKMLLQAFQSTSQQFTDESTLFFHVFGKVHFVEGQASNKKITNFGDVPNYRIGNGFDVHAFGEGSGVVLGGVLVPYNKKLVGHSDADVVAHAICDAVLSASENRDIGVQFPNTDNAYKGANSMHLLAKCVDLAKQNGYHVVNVSAVVVCQQPKLMGYLPQMSANISQVLGISSSCVNLSATTTEKLGALGNGDGIACQATALVAKI